MISKPRILLALGVCLLLVGLIVLGRWGPRRVGGPVETSVPMEHDDCRQCHQAVFGEWEASRHSRAWSDPNVQAAFQHFGFDRKCQSCHAPQPVLVTLPSVGQKGVPPNGLAGQVELRGRDLPSGVNCVSCHRTADGRGVAARRTIPDAPCRPVQTPQLATGEICGNCHDAIYQDWQQSRYSKEAVTCQDCHMHAGRNQDGSLNHLCLGSRHRETVRSGARMSCRQQGDELLVSVTNHATGHNFPGERHHRVLLVRVVEQKPTGEIVLAQQEVIKQVTPFRGESSADKIRAGETFEARFPVVDPPVVADVRLLYKTFPWLTDREALVVDRAEVKLEKP